MYVDGTATKQFRVMGLSRINSGLTESMYSFAEKS